MPVAGLAVLPGSVAMCSPLGQTQGAMLPRASVCGLWLVSVVDGLSAVVLRTPNCNMPHGGCCAREPRQLVIRGR